MENVNIFKKLLEAENKSISKLSLKNYLSDLRHFIKWYEKTLNSTFDISNVTEDIISLYKLSMGGIIENEILRLDNQLGVSSMKRHLSSLRKFFTLAQIKNYISENPFLEIQPEVTLTPADYWHLKSFKDYLLESHVSKLTVKNYISDISRFANWYEESVLPALEKPLSNNGGFYIIHQGIVEEYKKRLLEFQAAAPRTINRKLSSIRKYLEFAQKKGFIGLDEISLYPLRINEQSKSKQTLNNPTIDLEDIRAATSSRIYSKIPPVRLIQKLVLNPYVYAEDFITNSLATFITGKKFVGNLELPSKTSDILAGKKALSSQKIAIGEILGSKNVSSDFFKPTNEILRNPPLYKRFVSFAKTSRPQWYKKYHNYAFVHYVHFALLIIFATGVGITLYQNLIVKEQTITYASNLAPPRFLSFQGKLTDINDFPITTPTTVRFAIYNSFTSTGSALLWQEVHSKIIPDKDGLFSVTLGTGTELESDLFSENSSLFLGITVDTTPELTPRQRITSVPYATNSEFLHGMMPITSNGAGTTNVILALDTSGNLTIGGNASTTFSATGGEFKISGQPLVLSTNTGSNSNISLIPDGSGMVDIQKTIINTTNNGVMIPGGIEINDRFGVLATDSANAAFVVNNNTTSGDIISASSSGTTRFTLANDGSITSSFYNIAGGIIFTDSSGLFSQTSAGSNGQCLLSSGGNSPTWGSCGSSSTYIYNNSPFQELSGAIVPNNSTVDLILGGQSTSSAKFSVTGIAGNTTIASISGNLIVMPQDGWGGNIAAGNNNPLFRLHISDSKIGTSSAQIENLASNIGGDSGCSLSSCHTGLNIKLGTDGSSTAPGSADRFINFLQGDGTIIGKIRGTNNGSSAPGVAFDTAGGDFAEYFKKADINEDIPPGSLVCFKENESDGVTICDLDNTNILGVVSDVAGFVGNSSKDNDPNYILIGLIGQVPAFMSNENGKIEAGDALSNSLTKPGVVVKATSASKIVGRAITSYNDNFVSRVNILVQPSWFDPNLNFTSAGEFTIEPTVNQDQLFATDFTVKNTKNESITKTGVFAAGIFANLRSGLIESTNGIFTAISVQTAKISSLTVDSLIVGTNSITIAGKSLEDFILITIKNANLISSKDEILSPLASIDQINTNIISPLSNDTIIFKGNIDVRNEANKTVARIDTEGNASFSGTLTASSSAFLSSNITNLNSTDGTFSGTLYAQNIVTDNIEANNIAGLNDKISSIASSLIASNATNTTPTETTNLASQLTQTDFGLFSEGLTSLGPITGTQISAMDSLSVGTSFVMTENSLNTLGRDLEIQNLRQGGISFMGGLIKIDTDGNLNVGGNLNLLGNINATNGIFTNTLRTKALATNILSPLPGDDLIIKLSQSESTPSGKLQIQDSNGQQVLFVNRKGDIHSSGSANIAKLNFNLVGQAQATSLTHAIATGSAGFATLRKYQKEITIINKNVTENSLIYITPFGDTSNKIIYLLRQVPEDDENGTNGSFTVGVSGQPPIKNIQFNWLIVN